MSKDEIIAQQAKQIAELQASLQAALRRIADLEARLAQNSRNSSRPPSSDGLSKQPAFPRSSGKRHGGQPGHRGDTLQMVAQADQVVLHKVADVCQCGNALSEVSGQVTAKRQVFDLPPQAIGGHRTPHGAQRMPWLRESTPGGFSRRCTSPRAIREQRKSIGKFA